MSEETQGKDKITNNMPKEDMQIDGEQSPEITSPEKIKSFLPTVVNQLCVVRVDHENFAQPGKLLTDGTGFGFNGGIGFLPDNIEKIYPINVDIRKNEVRAVIYLKKP